MDTMYPTYATEPVYWGGVQLNRSNFLSKDLLRECRYKASIFLKDKAQYHREKLFPKVIESAMENGCNLFDTSSAYGSSESRLGEALKKYPRDKYFIITKIDNRSQYEDRVQETFYKSLKSLNVDYVDLLLLHWPVENIYQKSWKILEMLYEEGLCRAIGVSNFNIHHLESLEAVGNVKPMVDEFECHPLFTQNDLRSYCRSKDIQVIAYSSTARMNERLYKTCLVPIGKKYNKSVAQIILRWHQQIGNIPIVNSTNPRHLIENTQIRDFSLTDGEIDRITAININSRLRYDPDNCDFRQL